MMKFSLSCCIILVVQVYFSFSSHTDNEAKFQRGVPSYWDISKSNDIKVIYTDCNDAYNYKRNTCRCYGCERKAHGYCMCNLTKSNVDRSARDASYKSKETTKHNENLTSLSDFKKTLIYKESPQIRGSKTVTRSHDVKNVPTMKNSQTNYAFEEPINTVRESRDADLTSDAPSTIVTEAPFLADIGLLNDDVEDSGVGVPVYSTSCEDGQKSTTSKCECHNCDSPAQDGYCLCRGEKEDSGSNTPKSNANGQRGNVAPSKQNNPNRRQMRKQRKNMRANPARDANRQGYSGYSGPMQQPQAPAAQAPPPPPNTPPAVEPPQPPPNEEHGQLEENSLGETKQPDGGTQDHGNNENPQDGKNSTNPDSKSGNEEKRHKNHHKPKHPSMDEVIGCLKRAEDKHKERDQREGNNTGTGIPTITFSSQAAPVTTGRKGPPIGTEGNAESKPPDGGQESHKTKPVETEKQPWTSEEIADETGNGTNVKIKNKKKVKDLAADVLECLGLEEGSERIQNGEFLEIPESEESQEDSDEDFDPEKYNSRPLAGSPGFATIRGTKILHGGYRSFYNALCSRDQECEERSKQFPKCRRNRCTCLESQHPDLDKDGDKVICKDGPGQDNDTGVNTDQRFMNIPGSENNDNGPHAGEDRNESPPSYSDFVQPDSPANNKLNRQSEWSETSFNPQLQHFDKMDSSLPADQGTFGNRWFGAGGYSGRMLTKRKN